jgi:hypothetical protein
LQLWPPSVGIGKPFGVFENGLEFIEGWPLALRILACQFPPAGPALPFVSAGKSENEDSREKYGSRLGTESKSSTPMMSDIISEIRGLRAGRAVIPPGPRRWGAAAATPPSSSSTTAPRDLPQRKSRLAPPPAPGLPGCAPFRSGSDALIRMRTARSASPRKTRTALAA